MVGYYDQDPTINTEEVADWKWVDMDELKKDMNQNPHNYTEWFKIIFDKYNQYLVG